MEMDWFLPLQDTTNSLGQEELVLMELSADSSPDLSATTSNGEPTDLISMDIEVEMGKQN